MDGFRVYRADGSVQIDSNSLGFLFADEFYLGNGASSTRTLTGAAGQVAKVIATGVSSANANATITQANSGADLLVTVTSGRDGYFKIILSGGSTGTFGIQWSNTSGQLCVSSSQAGYVYLGNASYTGSSKTDAYSNIGTSGTYGFYPASKDPFYIYNISSAVAPTVAIQMNGGAIQSMVCSIRNIGTNLWEIVIATTAGTPPSIKCFGRLSGYGAAGYGIKLFDANGIRTWDSGENMLLVSQVFDWPAATLNSNSGIYQNFAHLTPNPYLISIGEAKVTGYFSAANGAYYDTTEYVQGYSGDTTTLYRTSHGPRCGKFRDDGPYSYNDMPADRTYIINGNLYP
jgi:hypothetical protein